MIIVISSLSLSFCVCACPVFFIYIDSTHILSSSLSRLSFFFCSIFFSSYLIKKKVLCPLPIPLFSFLVWTWTLSSSLVGKDFLSLSISLSLSLSFLFYASLLMFAFSSTGTCYVLCFLFLFLFLFFLVCGDSSVVGVSLFSWLFFPSLLCVRVLVSCFCFCFCFPFCSFYFSFVLCVPISYHRVLLGFVIFSFFFRLPPFFGALLCWLWFFFSQKNVQFVFFCLSFFCLS